MVLAHYPERDMLYNKLAERTSRASEEVPPGVVLDTDERKFVPEGGPVFPL